MAICATRPLLIAVLGVLAGGLSACSNNPAAPAIPQTSLVAVTPQGGASGVSPAASIVMQFSHAMEPQMEMYASLHEGDVTGPVISCIASWSSDSTTLTLTPSSPLKSASKYTLHIGGGMKDANGNVIDMTQHGSMMGGQWATGGMMTGGGMMAGGNEMGPGWQGSNGMYGMVFTFGTS